ncbi:uncharacterized protein SPPG_08565 [Spizellomyces punctatus DAOM BR117]|uniref:Uncharacterized protein n=1 Tax=Spizellomyces punctatus (strain DAOM BR117) TaxID=645134 RepID=A0A0L0H3B7_SPIPD|nr:uncharacterized protein SPPG_08565 [Spizellomyces punctatus DAOM BR117]KNC95960.1 hypothetical protein SPPG_08565 [Spizellomyces punctatus DAOM BR117]|eukprot:XP_016604000.1 hypothetical protein SPPG_08565 [Spizellomyces punctatus DAOM BR117]
MLPVDRRKEELEKKRARIAELRRAKEERKVALLDAQKRDSVGKPTRDRKDIDDLVASLVGDRPSSRASSTDELRSSSPSLSFTEPRKHDERETRSLRQDAEPQPDAIASAQEKPQPTLASAEFIFLDVAPKEKVMYTKEIQTETLYVEEAGTSDVEKSQKSANTPESVDVLVQPIPASENMSTVVTPQPRELSEDERKAIVASETFLDFFEYTTKLVERALSDTAYDFMTDYTTGDSGVIDRAEGKTVKLFCSFSDERWTRNRSVTDVSWSQKHPELVLASCGKNHAAISEPDGVVLIWNLHLRDRPEFVFQSQSDLTVARFADFHPNYIIGGTYSGQIVIWDTRAKNLPVLKTPLSAAGHTHPVYSMTIVGTQNAHNLVSASTDGLVCSWQLDMLAQPTEILDLVHPTHAKTDGVSVTTMAFPHNETATFWIGTEEGSIHQVNRYDRAGSKAGVNAQDIYKGHYSMVTGLNFHPPSGSADFSDLFLTSSVDWTIKLWRAKSIQKAPTSTQTITPLYSFEEADDYVYDVRWSPVHPSVFGSVDGSGRFDLYDLNQEMEVPIVSMRVGQGHALNKLAWDKEGRRTAIGSSDGQVFVYDIGEMSQPRSDEWALFQRTLAEIETR